MARAFCEDCQAVQEIVPTGKRQHPEKGTSCWWSLVLHKRPDRQEVCEGSGKYV